MSSEAPEQDPTETPVPTDPVRRAAVLDSARAERRALGICTAVAVATIIWITRPVGVGILLGMLLAFSLQRFYDRLVVRTQRPALTALGFVIVSALGLLMVLGGISSLLIARGAVLVQALIA